MRLHDDRSTQQALQAIRDLLEATQKFEEQAAKATQAAVSGWRNLRQTLLGVKVAFEFIAGSARIVSAQIAIAVDIMAAWRGEADELTKTWRAVEEGVQGVQATVGSLLVRALSRAVGGSGEVREGMRGLAEEVARADTSLGEVVRGGLALLIEGAGLGAQALLWLGQGLAALPGLAGVAQNALAGVFLEADRTVRANQVRDLFDREAELFAELERARGALSTIESFGHPDAVLGQQARVDALADSLARIQEEQREAGREYEAFLESIRAQERATEESTASLSRQMAQQRETFESLRSRVAELTAGMVAGLEGDIDVPEPPRRPAGGTGAERERRRQEAAERATDDAQSAAEHVQIWASAYAARVEAAREAARRLEQLEKLAATAKHEQALEVVAQQQQLAQDAAEKRLQIIRQEADAAGQRWQQEADALNQIWQSAVNSMVGGLVRLAGDTDATFAQIAQSMLSSIGSTMQQISIAMIAGGTASGPFGVPMLLFGIGAQVAAALLGRGGGGRGARAANAATGVRAPLERGTPQQVVNYVVQAGWVFASRDALRRGFSDLARESAELGE
jgi:hypothetical protein